MENHDPTEYDAGLDAGATASQAEESDAEHRSGHGR